MERRAQAPGSAHHYSLGTHGIEVPDPSNPDETIPGVGCSCASLVEWCYEQASVDLVAEESLPRYTLQEVHAQFCPRHPRLGRPSFTLEQVSQKLVEWNLSPSEAPWPLLLPAQQMHAFSKGVDALPHCATKADHPFVPA